MTSRAVYYEADVYCEDHAPEGSEPEAMPQETDTPENCSVCGRPLQYALTPAGVQYVLDAIKEALYEWPLGAEKGPSIRKPDYYEGCSNIAVVQDWAKDLKNYGGLHKLEYWLIDYFLWLTR
jgi:hypothetical protein